MPINQTVEFSCSPADVYRALTSSEAFASATGAPADIAPDEGGAFSCFGGQITGRHVELSPDRRIVQAWRAGPWPEGAYSIVSFDIAPSDGGATLTMEHAGYPDTMGDHLEGGWQDMYWKPLQAHLGGTPVG